jgi:hypothetical protein
MPWNGAANRRSCHNTPSAGSGITVYNDIVHVRADAEIPHRKLQIFKNIEQDDSAHASVHVVMT